VVQTTTGLYYEWIKKRERTRIQPT
jgi:hypothetical protein